ncbi:MAG: hypothetical protein ACTHWA_04245 [Arachnia sp.]
MASKRLPELHFEVDFDASSPAMISSSVGIDRVAHRPSAVERRDITIVDTDDERLLRAGIVMAHRMVAGRGEWYLAAPSWQPRLPAEQVEPLGAKGSLPEEFVRMIGPIIRRAAVGPVAAMECDRREYQLRDESKAELALICDEKVVLRRGSSTVHRYRQVTVRPSATMTPQQMDSVLAAMGEVGAIQVEHFHTVQQRLGAPATGLTDFPRTQPLRSNATMEELVSAVFAADLWSITALLLDEGRNRRPHVATLNAQLESVQRDLHGLAHALAPAWRQKVEDLLEGLPFENLHDAAQVALDVADALVTEVRAPKLGDIAGAEAAPLLLRRAEQAAFIMSERCSALTVGSTDQAWEAALKAAEMLAVSASVAEPVLGKPLRKIARRLQAVTEHLRACSSQWDQSEISLDGMTVEDAYDLGRQVERVRASSVVERGRFVSLWPDRLTDLRSLLAKAKRST